MAKYRVSFHAYASSTVIVEADSADEAGELAYEELPTICARCSGWGESATLDLGDFEMDDDEEFQGVSYPAIQLVED